jgi:hypothetical protein
MTECRTTETDTANFPHKALLRCALEKNTRRARVGGAEGPSEDYGNDEHTTVAAFLPWRGS